MSSTPSKSRDFARKMICVVGREFGRNTKMRIKPGDHQILGNVIEAHQSLRFLCHLFWFDRRVLAAKIKIRLSIFAHKGDAKYEATNNRFAANVHKRKNFPRNYKKC